MATADAIAGLAGALLIAAMVPRSLRAMRVLALAAGLAALAWLLVLGAGAAWLGLAGAFVAVNAVQLVIALRRSVAGDLLPAERELFEEVMRIEEPAQQRRLRDLIDWRDVAAGTTLMHEGECEPPLLYVGAGEASIDHGGSRVGMCGKGDFLGEMSVLSGDRASATVIATGAMRVARIDRDALSRLAREVPEIGRAFDAALNRSLAAKVLRMNRAAGAGMQTGS